MEKSDHDLDSNRNHLARQSDSSVPAAAVEAKMDSSNESEMKQSHPVIAQDRKEEDLPSQPHTPTPPQKLPVNRNQETEVESNDGTPSKQRRCRCKISRCLKMYCDCFASGSYCNGCNCVKCHNTLENETERQEAIKATLERNPGAFKPKIAGSPHGLNDLQEDVRQLVILGKRSRGCNCKKSGCLKNYCECYHTNVRCSHKCRCHGCKNVEGSQEIQRTTNAAVKRAIDMSCYLHTPESRKRNLASHSVAARGSSPVPHLVQNQTVNYVVRNGDTSLFTVPNNKAALVSTTGTYRSSLSNTMQLRHVKELCSLLVSKSVEVANKMSGANEKDSSLDPYQRDANVINDSPDCVLDDVRKDEKPMSPATGALMCDDEHVNISEKETFAPERTSQEEEDRDTSSEVYLEQERQILSCFKDHLIQLLNRGSIYGRNIQKANTDPSRKEPEDEEEQSHRDSSFGCLGNFFVKNFSI